MNKVLRLQVLIDSGAVDLVVVDSVAALVPRAEIDGDIGDSHVGLVTHDESGYA